MKWQFVKGIDGQAHIPDHFVYIMYDHISCEGQLADLRERIEQAKSRIAAICCLFRADQPNLDIDRFDSSWLKAPFTGLTIIQKSSLYTKLPNG